MRALYQVNDETVMRTMITPVIPREDLGFERGKAVDLT
jgi:hypothetical protein